MKVNYQYSRRWSLYIASKGGDALDLSGLKCVFSISKKDAQSPNEARFVLFNISKQNSEMLKKSFEKITVSAGYPNNFGIIFSGNVKSYTFGRDRTELYLDIKAGDGDKAYNYSVISKSLAAGATPDNIVQELSNAMGVPVGFKSELDNRALPRGKVMYGRPQEFMREQSDGQGCTWSIQDGEILMLKRTAVKEGEAVLLTPKTGLIGVPTQTDVGVTGKCLLNPKLQIGAAVKLESEYTESLNGEYRLIKVTHKGDTRGNDWYTEFTALSLTPSGKDKVEKK